MRCTWLQNRQNRWEAKTAQLAFQGLLRNLRSSANSGWKWRSNVENVVIIDLVVSSSIYARVYFQFLCFPFSVLWVCNTAHSSPCVTEVKQIKTHIANEIAIGTSNLNIVAPFVASFMAGLFFPSTQPWFRILKRSMLHSWLDEPERVFNFLSQILSKPWTSHNIPT